MRLFCCLLMLPLCQCLVAVLVIWNSYIYFFGKLLQLLELTDDEDEYEEAEGGNRLLGFMFGNVDGAGDLDVDYLDEVMCFICFLLLFIIDAN